MKPLVNCHTHLELGWLADICPAGAGEPFVPWIIKLVNRNRHAAESGQREKWTQAAIEQAIQTLLACGTTHIGNICQSGLSIEPLLDSGLAGVVYIEVIGSETGMWSASFERAKKLVERYRPAERNGLRIGLSPHAPYSTHPEAFQEVTAYCLQEALPMCIHLAESPAETEMLLHGRGPFVDLSRAVRAIPIPAPGLSPVAYMEDLGVLAARPLLVHVVQVDDHDLDKIAASGAKIAHCPRSNSRLQCGRMALEKMLARRIPVALGTDSLASSPSLDVLEEAEAAVAAHEGWLPAGVIQQLLGNTAVLT